MNAPWSSAGLRTTTAAICGVLGILLTLVGGLLAYGERSLFDSEVFADRAAQSLTDPRVASYAADHITNAVILAERDLTMVRPVIHATAEVLVGSGPFRAVARRAFRRAHELLLTEGGREVLLSMSDVGVIFRSALATRPDLLEKIPPDIEAVLRTKPGGPLLDFTSQVMRIGKEAGTYSRLLFWSGIILLLLSLVAAVDRKLAVFRSGVSLLAAALLVLILVKFGGSILAAMVEDRSLGAALAGVWGAFSVGLRNQALALGAIGILMTAASTAVLERVQLDAILRALRRALWDPTARKSVRVLRSAVLLAIGAVAILQPQTLLSLLVIVAGGAALFLGFREFFRVVLPPSLEQAPRAAAGGARGRRLLGYAVAGALALAVVVTALYVMSGAPDVASESTTMDAYNGQRSLADRRLNEVVFPASHNSMSAADIPSWMFPNQEHGLRSQLEYGIRGLLFDVYAGTPVGNAVKTDVGQDEIAGEKYVPIIGEEGVAAATRIRDRMVGGKEGDRALYMCHGLCELGATPLVEALAGIREFLVMNPNEVLILIIEDYVKPEEIEAAFEESGLIDFVFRGKPRPPWPTLRQMVVANQQVLVLAEHDSQGVDWYHPAFEVFQETPYHFESPEDFSNVPNRGGTAGSLLLMNHWIATDPSSLPSNAEKVNAYDFLLARARACEKERGMTPNVIAVDFYHTGDLLRVVRTLNGITGAED